jgi:hypothetical protein
MDSPANRLMMAQADPRSPVNRLAPQVDPYDFTNRYNTTLSTEDEAAFLAWGQQQAAARGGRNPATDVYDYDMRGFWKSGGSFDAGSGHAGDAYKKPNHPTFSDQSRYHGVDEYQGGQWGGGQNGQPWTYTPSPTNLRVHGPEGLLQYFQRTEPGNLLVLPP